VNARQRARSGDLCPASLHPLPAGWDHRRGCRSCVHDQALTDAAMLTVAAVPGLPDDQARDALTAVTAGGRAVMHAHRYEQIAAHLREHADALTSGASTTPVDVARLITALRQGGRDEVADPRCADCDRPCFPRGHRPDGLRICPRCSSRRRNTACGRCGNVRAVCTRRPDGAPLCQPCRYDDPAIWRPCGRCGRPGPIRFTLRGVGVGNCCYLKPHERCSVCGLGRAVSPYASGKATCAQCATQPHTVCAGCGLDAPLGQGTTAATCLRCLAGTNRPCRVCTTPTVSRDNGGQPQCATCLTKTPRACGGCGRDRVIVRRATGTDVDLCAACWQGPTTTCAGCGRRRPCRGERSGRMLCKTCTPRPKQPCGYCGNLRRVVTTWADGPACASCYRRFMRAKDTCPSCSQHRRLLPHIGQQQPVCAACAGAPPGPVCGQCGNEDWLYHKDRCARCVLANRLGDLLGDTDNRVRLGLQPLFDTLAQAENPETVIAWTHPSVKGNGTADLLLARLGRGDIPLSHETLDALNTPGNGGTANHLDAILTAIGALPPRDLELARLERAVNTALDLLTDDQQRKTLRSYATWDLLRGARTTSRRQQLTPMTRHATTARLATATHLLTWLAQRGLDLTTCRQDDLDTYLVTHPARRSTLHGFLAWARRTHRTKRLAIASRPKRLPGIVPADDHGRWALARDLLHEDDHTPADRVAGLLVLLFGQRPHHISHLTTEHVGLHGSRVTLKLGTSPIELPEPFSTHVKTLIDTRRAKVAKRVADPGPWLFPSQHPDRPALPETITHRLQRLGIQPSAHRAAALLHLAAELPPAVLSDLLGLGRTAVQDWSTLAARPWASYVADRIGERGAGVNTAASSNHRRFVRPDAQP
jgi:hypothetical protein